MKERLERILGILATLQSGTPTDINSLTAKFGVTRRTIFRDLAVLSEAGADCTFERAKGEYVLNQSPVRPVDQLTQAETLNLLLMLRVATSIPTFTDREPAKLAKAKVRGSISADLVRDMDGLLSCLSVREAAPLPAMVFDDVFYATSRKQQLELSFHDGKKKTVYPYRLNLDNDHWTLDAFSPADARCDMFALTELQSARVLKSGFTAEDIPNRRDLPPPHCN